MNIGDGRRRIIPGEGDGVGVIAVSTVLLDGGPAYEDPICGSGRHIGERCGGRGRESDDEVLQLPAVAVVMVPGERIAGTNRIRLRNRVSGPDRYGGIRAYVGGGLRLRRGSGCGGAARGEKE